MILVSTDGSCKPNPGQAGCGYVIVIDNKIHRQASVYLGEGTNNIAELKAVEIALQALIEEGMQEQEIELQTDSAYAVGLFTKNWKAKANTELVNKIRADLEQFPKLSLSWIKGHNGSYYNELADKLANQAIDLVNNNAR